MQEADDALERVSNEYKFETWWKTATKVEAAAIKAKASA